ncbi:MAG TPA: amidase domain-containing protein [Bacillota bacterium]|jgi:hypothetical protein|nr:amidase domain-containing protein [Bacillota bacterium]
MLINTEYNRNKAVLYAEQWAFGRNPAYLDFEELGGDCTNFVSQCIYAGCGAMNFTPTFGWYYTSASNRAPAWTGVQYLYNFLINNKKEGPYAITASSSEMAIGDIIQLGRSNGHFYHSPIVCGIVDGRIFVSAHSYDAWMRPLNSYEYGIARYIHILGARRSV